MDEEKKHVRQGKGLTRREALKISSAALAYTMVPAPFVHARKKINLRFINCEADPGTVKFFDKIFEEYENKTGIKVLMDTVPAGQAYAKLTASLKAGNPYDLANLFNVAEMVIGAEEGWLVPMTSLIKKIGVDDFGPRILFPYKDDFWWYPYDYNFGFWYYRTDIFKDKGLKEPKTWQAFIDNAKACTVDKDKDGMPDMYGLCMSIANGGFVDMLSCPFMWAEGVKFYDDDWNVIFDGPEMKPKVARYLKFYKELYQYMPPGMSTITWGDYIKLFITERVAMSPYAGRLIHHVERHAPHLSDKIGTFVYPSSDGSQFAVSHGYDGWSVVKTKYSEESLKFMEWLVLEKLIDFYATLAVHYQPTQLSIYDDPRWKAIPAVKKYPVIVQNMKNWLTTKDLIIENTPIQGPYIDPRAGKVSTTYVMSQMHQNLILKKLPPEKCCEIAADQMRKIMKG